MMKARIIKWIVIFLLAGALLTYFLIMPLVRWELDYDYKSMTPKETIEYFFSAINERNPKKALNVYSVDDSDDNQANAYSLDFLLSCDVKNITDVSDKMLKDDPSDEWMFLVEFENHYLFGLQSNVFSEASKSGDKKAYIKVEKDTPVTGRLYITELNMV